MLFLLSPAKSLDYDTAVGDLRHTRPLFADQSAQLIAVLKKKSVRQLAQLMGLSDTLAGLNVARYRAWSPRFTEKNSRQAVLAFNGDVYDGLKARSFKAADLEWAQERLCILSGLYGVLRPLDRIQPYRLEMGCTLSVGSCKNLYQYWSARIVGHLNRRLASDRTPVVVNLASQEYSKVVDRGSLKAQVIDCVFEEDRDGGYKIVGFAAKKARGLMARYAIGQRIETPRQLAAFNLEGYAFDPDVSRADRMVFRRRSEQANPSS